MSRENPRWSDFAVKTKKSIHDQFEDLCRMLFCDELNIKQGSLQYVRNQPGNETYPIEHKGHLIGFQSKFFEGKFNVNDFEDSIRVARDKHPNQDTIHLYSNIEPPSEKIRNNLLSFGKELNMVIVCHFNKNILDQVAEIKNKNIYEIFFNLDSEAEKIISNNLNHTYYYLEGIQTTILYNNLEIKFDRQRELEELIKAVEENNVVIITGYGGCGKSSLMKSYLNEIRNKLPVDDTVFPAVLPAVIYHGESMNNLSIKEMLGCDASTFFEIYNYKCLKHKLFIIDSAEQMLLGQKELEILFRELIKKGWNIIITCRIDEKTPSLFEYFQRLNLSVGKVDIHMLSDKEIYEIAKKHSFTIPADQHLRDYIKKPFYLNLYLNNERIKSQRSFSKYKKELWNKTICGDGNHTEQKRRRNIVLNLAKSLYLNCQSFSVDSSDDNALDELIMHQILKCDKSYQKYSFSHDLYGEWAITELIENDYEKKRSISDIYKTYKVSITGLRCFRHWISDNLNSKDFSSEIITILSENDTNDYYDEIIKSILQSDGIDKFLQNNSKLLTENNLKLLKKFLFWLRVSCVYISKDDLVNATYNRVPIGIGWDIIIDFISELELSDRLSLYYDILAVLMIWSRANERGDTTRKSGEIAMSFLTDSILPYYTIKMIPIVFLCTYEILNDIETLLNNILAREFLDNSSLDYHILEYLIKEGGTDVYRLSKCFPELVMRIWDYCWHGGHIESKGSLKYEDYGLDGSFIIDSHSKGILGTSILYSMVANRRFVEDFIIEFLNEAVEYYNSHQKKLDKIVIILDDCEFKQFSSETFWLASCNTLSYSIPELIRSLLLALQSYLCNMIETGEVDVLCLKNLIKKSNNVMITSVVTSVALRNLNDCQSLVDELAQSDDLKLLERKRLEEESFYNFVMKDANKSPKSLSLSEKQSFNAISLNDYTQETISLPSFLCEEKDESVMWAEQVFNGQICKSEDARKYVKESKGLLDSDFVVDLGLKLYLSHANAIAPAYIMFCRETDEYTLWCCDVILDILQWVKNRPDEVRKIDLCVKSVPKLLTLYPNKRKEIFETLLSVCVCINKTDFSDSMVEIIRKGDLWDKYQSDMIDFIKRYKAFCKNRSGKLLPEEVSLILRMLPQKTVFKIEWLRLSLIKIFYVFTKEKIKGIQLYNDNPICEILIYQPFSWVGKYTFRKLKKLLINEDDYNYFLYGLIDSLEITNNTDNFFGVWKKLAKKVYASRQKKSFRINWLKSILTFQYKKDVVIKIIEKENNTSGQDFNNKCYEFLNYLVENYDVDKHIIKSILFITDNAQTNKFALWLSLLHIALKKSGYEIIHKVGLSTFENVVLKDYDIFYKGRGYDINNFDDIQGIIDMMIRCGSAKAYYFKEIFLEKAAKPR